MLIRRQIKGALNRLGLQVTRVRPPGTPEKRRPKQPKLDPSLYDRYPADSIKGRRFYNIGAGSFAHPYWTNIDYATGWYGTVQNAFTEIYRSGYRQSRFAPMREAGLFDSTHPPISMYIEAVKTA